MKEQSVAIVGGGPAGLTLALILAQKGFSLDVIDPKLLGLLSSKKEATFGGDQRTVALMRASLNLYQQIGLEFKEPEIAPLEQLHLIDQAGTHRWSPKEVLFHAQELGGNKRFSEDSPPFFALNVPLPLLVSKVYEALRLFPRVRFHASGLKSFEYKEAQEEGGRPLSLLLEDESCLETSLLIGADGKNSHVRTLAGIKVNRKDYGQRAFAFQFSHEKDHGNCSTEFHRHKAGPLVLVPMAGKRSAVVWVETEKAAQKLMDTFEGASNKPFGGGVPNQSFQDSFGGAIKNHLGEMKDFSCVSVFPLTLDSAQSYASESVVLVGEALHALPPVGAQGLNLSLADVAVLTELLVDYARQGKSLSDPSLFRTYKRRRFLDVQARLKGIDLFNLSIREDKKPLHSLRILLLESLEKNKLWRKAFMIQGMKPLGPVPKLMRGEDL